MKTIILPNYKLLTKPTTFYFVRHGESKLNVGGVIQGRNESELSSTGVLQAEAIGKWLSQFDIGAIFSSPLSRAYQTAMSIGKFHDIVPQSNHHLIEVDYGLFSGKNWKTVQQQYPKSYGRFLVHSWEAVPQAEKMRVIVKRVRTLWHTLIATANQTSSDIICVAHMGILQWVLKASAGAPYRWMPLYPMSNCGVFAIYIRPEWYHRSHISQPHSEYQTAKDASVDVNQNKYAVNSSSGSHATNHRHCKADGAYISYRYINYTPENFPK